MAEFDQEKYNEAAKLVTGKWCILEHIPLIDLLASELNRPYDETAKKTGKVILLSLDAWPVYLAVGEAYEKQYKRMPKDDYGSTAEEKARGISGNDAIHSALNQCKIFYQTDQLFASFKSDRIWHDFILWPKKTRLEVKTSSAEAPKSYLNLNKKHWRGSNSPDVVIALKQKLTSKLIMLEFVGWLQASEVNESNFELKEFADRPEKSYFRCEVDKLNPPVNLRGFLTGLANEGKQYLATLK